ncbi:Uma2 family endonuclease [Thiolapillus sp.]
MSIVTKAPDVTPEEYLEGEELSEYKHEYENGHIIAMVGANRNHNIIQINLTGALFNHVNPSFDFPDQTSQKNSVSH